VFFVALQQIFCKLPENHAQQRFHAVVMGL